MESDESDGSFPPWVSLEYTQMLSLAHPSPVIFSSLSVPSVDSLRQLLTPATPSSNTAFSTIEGTKTKGDLSEFRTEHKSVGELMNAEGIDLSRVCLLDPKADKAIHPSDREEFDWFLSVHPFSSLATSSGLTYNNRFGGILGDDPPRDRTAELRKQGFPTRHLGAMQMTTDTALGVTKLVVQDQSLSPPLLYSSAHSDDSWKIVPMEEIPFVDNPTIRFDEVESVEMPFRYVRDKEGEPILPRGMRKLLQDDMDKAFE